MRRLLNEQICTEHSTKDSYVDKCKMISDGKTKI